MASQNEWTLYISLTYTDTDTFKLNKCKWFSRATCQKCIY